MTARTLVFASVLSLAATTAVDAQWSNVSPGYTEGLNRGVRAGEEDSRRRESYNFSDESDYRNADAGYRSQYGSREYYRDEFRRGYEAGYRSGYGQYGAYGGTVPNGPTYDGRGPYNGRRPSDGRVPYDPRSPYGTARPRDLAYATGYNDGYERGLDDGHDRRRFDPVGESRYRSADNGYERAYGTKELYKQRYREAFRTGYEQGYEDGRRFNGQRPRWWPFGS